MAARYIAFALALFFFAATASAATINATSCSYADVQAAVNSANSGDTVIVPTGSCTWSSTLTITKGITFQGAGIGSTFITRSGSDVFVIDYNPNATTRSNDTKFEVSGFTFIGPRGIRLYEGGDETVPLRNNKIHDNRFEMSSMYPLYIAGSFWGVVYNNQFAGTAGHGNWLMILGHNRVTWDALGGQATPGTGDNLYFEDNVFTGDAINGYQSGQGGRLVWRYNTHTIVNIDTPLFDEHGCQGAGGVYGLMLSEMYGNLFSGTYQNWFQYQRGGKLFVFNNQYTGPSANSKKMKQEYLYDFPTECPLNTGSEHPPNAYVWNNFYGSVTTNMIESTDNYDVIGEDVSFWNYNASCTSSSCSAGIGCGSTAPTGTCTTGVGYWVTSYSPCSTPPATMADIKTYTQIGTLYKCTAPNTWILYYTPYSYPHPLRSVAQSCTVNSECDNGLFCDGFETCSAGACVTGTSPCVDDGYSCTTLCDEVTDSCNVPNNVVCLAGYSSCTSATCNPATYPVTGCGNYLPVGCDVSANSVWVSANGLASWPNCVSATPLSGAAACSLTTANANARSGDTVYLRAGTYNNYIQPANSGTAAQRIVYQNYGSEVVNIRDTIRGIHLDGESYITVQGINFENLDTFLWLENNANNNIIAYNTFNQGRNVGWSGSKIYRSSQYNWVHHNTFSKYGYFTSSSIGSVLDLGDEYSQTDVSSHNLIEDNIMYHGGHHVLGVYGMYNVIRNNYLHNEAWSNGYGQRVVYVNGYAVNSGRNLFEGNRIAYSDIPPSNPGSDGMQTSNNYNVIRHNLFYYNNLAGIGMSATSSYISDIMYNKIYNNAFLHNGWNPPTGSWCPDAMCSAIGFALYSGSWIIKYNTMKNNIYYDHYQTYGYYNVNPNDQIFAGNWDGDTQGDPKFVNASKTPGDPMDSSLPDLHLQSSSPAIDQGAFLTAITSPSGSGNVFNVEDAGYFIDGWGIVEGDLIQLQGQTGTAQITSINYGSNTITVDKSLTWTRGQGIALAFKGSAPDAGAYEYGGGVPPTCTDSDGDGYGANCAAGADCNDANPSINPGAAENCSDTIDNDCDSLVDCFDPNCSTNTSCTQCPAGQIRCNNVCVTPTCSTNMQCNDSNVLTSDVCLNAGTCNASCSFTPYAGCGELITTNCSCGGTIYSTGLCCNNVYRAQAVCSADADCNDQNSLTNDACLNAGTCSAACSNTPTNQPVCTEGQTTSCVTSDLCAGTRTCSNNTWGDCVKDNPLCPIPPVCSEGETTYCVTLDNCAGTQTCVSNAWTACTKLDSKCPQSIEDLDADGVPSSTDCNDADKSIGLCTGCATCSAGRCVAGSCPSTACTGKSECKQENYYSYPSSVSNDCLVQGGLGTCTAKNCIPSISLNDERCTVPGHITQPPEIPGEITEKQPQIEEILPIQIIAAAIVLVALAVIAIALVLRHS